MNTVPTLEQLLESYATGEVDDRDLATWFQLDPERSGAFSPEFRSNPELRSARSGRGLGDSLINALNAASRRRRRLIYDQRRAGNFGGVHIVSEGDSWFQFPVLVKDTIDHLIEDQSFAVLSLGAAGDTIESMVRRGELVREVARRSPDIVLISAGGNDVLADGGLELRLSEGGTSRDPDAWISRYFYETLDNVLVTYNNLIDNVLRASGQVQIVVHGYEYARPQPGGSWLGSAFRQSGITNRGLQGQIVKTMLDTFNHELAVLASAYPQVTYVDVRNTVRMGQWFDELHPDSRGFEKIASRIKAAIAT